MNGIKQQLAELNHEFKMMKTEVERALQAPSGLEGDVFGSKMEISFLNQLSYPV